MKGTILVVDDEEQLRKLLLRILALEGYNLLEAPTLFKAEQLLKSHDVDLVLCDMKLPDGSGVAFIPVIKKLRPATAVILLTAYGNIPDGIQAMKNGAFDYLTKGNDNDRIIPLVAQAISQSQSEKSRAINNRGLLKALPALESRDASMQQLIALAQKIAPSQSAVLLSGETGTGKEVMAQSIHQWSPLSHANFVAINCSAFPKDLLESELFGHAAGSFTGATKDKKGLAEAAHGGTLFLDEIGEMPVELQAKMLRFLESGEFFRVGETKLTRVQVRVIAATNKNLEQQITEGRFRKDLFYRLNTFTLTLPPLRERIEDIQPLAQYFIQRFSRMEKKTAPALAPAALRALQAYAWPGNIRELRNLMERAVILCDHQMIDLPDLPPQLLEQADGLPSTSLADMEKAHIRKILDKTSYHKTKAANLLGIGLATLYRKMDEYGIPK